MMKRLALLLVFSLILSAFPMDVLAGHVSVSGGPVPTILRIENVTVSRDSNSHHLRFLNFTAADLGIFGASTSAHAVLTLTGNNRRWVRDSVSVPITDANWTFVQNNMLPAGLTGASRNNILFFGRSGTTLANTLCVVLIAQDGINGGRSSGNQAILLVYVGSDLSGGTAGISMPVQFYAGGQDGNVMVQLRGARGFSPANQDILVAAVLGGGPATTDDETAEENAQNGTEPAPDPNDTQTEVEETEENGHDLPGPSFPYPPLIQFRTIRLVIDDVNYTINDVPAVAELAPFIDPVYERTMVPLRMVAEALGAQVDWIEETRTVTLAAGSRFITLQVDTPLPDGMGTPVIINDRTFVPVRYVGEMLGAYVQWAEFSRAVYIRMQVN